MTELAGFNHQAARDAAFMVTVPFNVPDTPRIEHNTVFMYFYDRFTRPYAFQGDVAVSIDGVLDDKVHALDALESQVYEGGASGSEEVMREKAAGDPVARKKLLAELWSQRHQAITGKYRDTVIEWYGEEQGRHIKHAEIFEICEYGHQPTQEELRRLFPFYDNPVE
ncbi:MAG: hypothetical protein AB7I48_04615 [Planctomycetaceae bacterium]